MNKPFLVTAATVAIGLSTLSVFAQPQPRGPQAPATRRDTDRRPRPERHPELRTALRQLISARDALNRGARDFGGHRRQAVTLTEQAIAQVNLALRYDNR